MSGFETAGGNYTGKEAVDIILRPQHDRMKPEGILVVSTKGAGTYRMTVADTKNKILMPYADGWQGGSGATLRQKSYTLSEMKAEAGYSKQDYGDIVQSEALRLANNVENDIDGTIVATAEKNVMGAGVQDDLFRYFWLGDEDKLHLAGGTYPDGTTTYTIGTEDKYYSVCDGIWTQVIADSAAYASATEQQIRRVNLNDGTDVLGTPAEANVRTLTVTGTSGTATVTVKGLGYTATFDTNVATTAANFVTAHAATILTKHKVVVTNPSGADIVFTGSIPGVDISLAVATATGDLSGSLANTNPTVVAALGTDEAADAFKFMWENSNPKLRQRKSQARFYVTENVLFNYTDTLESGGTEQARTAMVDGVERYTWRGIPIIPVPIDTEIEDDFEGEYPIRILLTTVNNLVEVLAVGNNRAELVWWFERKDNMNLVRVQMEIGQGYMMPELMTAGF